MKNNKILEHVNALSNFADLLFETDKTNVYDINESNKDDKADLLGEYHFHIDNVNLLGLRNSECKTKRCTVDNTRICANKDLYSEELKEKYGMREHFTLNFVKNPCKNYFYIPYTDTNDLIEIVSILRNNYYERISSFCIEKNVGLELKFKDKEVKKSATKKKDASATKKRVKATK